MLKRPFDHEAQDFRRVLAFDHTKVVNGYHGLVLVVDRMEKGRAVIVEVHEDDDSEESAYFRHVAPY